MPGREGEGVVRMNPDGGGGGAQATAGRLLRPEEVPLIGVGLHAARQPGFRGGIPACVEGPTV